MPNTVSPGRSVFSPPLPLTSFLLSSVLPYIITSLLPLFRIFFQVPYPATPLFATLTKTAGVYTNNSHFGSSRAQPRETLRASSTFRPFGRLSELSPFLSDPCALFCTFLHSA